MSKVDVAIVGGGIVGGTLACALAPHMRVALIDPRVTASDARRVSTITLASRRILHHTGVWSHIALNAMHPLRRMHIGDARGSGQLSFDAADVAQTELGFIVENSAIEAAIATQLELVPNLTRASHALSAFTTHADGALVRLADSTQLEALLVVGADGVHSTTRTLAGIALDGASYDQAAIVCEIRTERAHAGAAFQRFLPTGPLAFLPLDDNRSSIVWSADAAFAQTLMALDDARFAARLSEASARALGEVLEAGPRLSFPLGHTRAREYVRARLALCGDAAHSIHPLAGQGLNLGLLDVASLAEVVRAAADARRDIGALATLRRYERWRKGDNLAMFAVTDGLKRLFQAQGAWLAWGRNRGFDAVDRIPPLKRLLISRAMGLRGDLPRLARP